ncbi:MAG: DUF1127 domain-containing protein [Yoonia sp.]|uniref:DUF1127 domain-containing protein n=1 Tax=Yoonia sp. TaxID=2212373 RepID=UPI003EF8F8B2
MSYISDNSFQSSCSQPQQASLWQRGFAMMRLARQRRQLAALEPHLLQDIGITADAAKKESRKAPWQAPAHWRG